MPDPAFSLVPVEDSVDAETALEAAAESALEDAYAIPEPEDPPIPFGRTWAFDHDHGRFIRSAGSPAEVLGDNALIEYVQASLRTAAGVHPGLPPSFGIERPEDFLGAADPSEAISDFEDRARRGLRGHDRIRDVRGLEVDIDLSQGIVFVSNFLIITDQEEAIPVPPFNIEPEG
ncbi:MAG: DUF2634 domain-containing protein [Solirubrobacterales bacterium]